MKTDMTFEVPDGELRAEYTAPLPRGLVPQGAKRVGEREGGAAVFEDARGRFTLLKTAGRVQRRPFVGAPHAAKKRAKPRAAKKGAKKRAARTSKTKEK